MNIFELNGVPSEDNPYLFNGDFVDRGSFSVECIFVLFSFKLLYPNHFFMSRGNHESENMNKMYGFEGEVKAKYSANMVDLFTEVYNWLPLAHNINNRILVMHGGLFSKVRFVISGIEPVSFSMHIIFLFFGHVSMSDILKLVLFYFFTSVCGFVCLQKFKFDA